MIYVLTGIVVLLAFMIILLAVDLHRGELRFRRRTDMLRSEMYLLSANNRRRKNKLKVALDMERRIVSARERLTQELLSLQYDLVGTLVKNNLLE